MYVKPARAGSETEALHGAMRVSACARSTSHILKSTGMDCRLVQTVEARESYYNRTMGAIKAGGNFVQTSFPDVAQLPKYAYSVPGSSNATYTNYTVLAPPPFSPHSTGELVV